MDNSFNSFYTINIPTLAFFYFFADMGAESNLHSSEVIVMNTELLLNNIGKDIFSRLERSIYALGLLEALARVGLPFIFKGGTCLQLLLENPMRLSTDIDIIVKPGTDFEHFLEEFSKKTKRRKP
jgi:hypothetical protein